MSPELTAMDTDHRLDRLRTEFDSEGVDALLVTRPINIRWLCGFTGSNGRLLVTRDTARLVTDARYTEQAAAELLAAEVAVELDIVAGDGGQAVSDFLKVNRPTGIEARHATVSEHRSWQEQSSQLVATEGLVEKLRQLKDDGEIARLRRASEIADVAFATTVPFLVERPTERRFGAELDHQMRLAGADDLSFESIVGSGPNGAKPHARPTDRVIEPTDLVVLDFGAKVDGYGSDMTRTVLAGGAQGTEPSKRQADLYDAVAAAQRAGVAVVADGVAEVEVDAACRQVLADRGLAEAFTHGTGHGIGLEIHEQPILSTRSVGILRAGLVVTVEPGAYLPGFGGVRVEDSVVVTGSGCEPITHSPKGLVPEFTASTTERTPPNGDDHE